MNNKTKIKLYGEMDELLGKYGYRFADEMQDEYNKEIIHIEIRKIRKKNKED